MQCSRASDRGLKNNGKWIRSIHRGPLRMDNISEEKITLRVQFHIYCEVSQHCASRCPKPQYDNPDYKIILIFCEISWDLATAKEILYQMTSFKMADEILRNLASLSRTYLCIHFEVISHTRPWANVQYFHIAAKPLGPYITQLHKLIIL